MHIFLNPPIFSGFKNLFAQNYNKKHQLCCILQFFSQPLGFRSMNYQETLSYLYTQLPMFQRVGKIAFKKDLGNIQKLCLHLEQPQEQFKTVHIAGTNGKGSTAHILASILQEAGYKVGLYTSPHYKDFRERIKIDGQYISETAVVKFVEQYRSFFEELKPSFFEITVALAFYYFEQEKVDIAIIETGLGGRLDSTNIVQPLVSIITNIGYDHQQFLGDTLPEIASEKAGIIKAKTPIIIGEFHLETLPVFKKKAKELNAPLQTVWEQLKIEYIEQKGHAAVYNVFGLNNTLRYKNLELGLLGAYQIHNLGNVLLGIDELKKQGFAISEQDVRQGCKKVVELSNIMGRWQILQDSPLVICDSAHNEHGLSYLFPALKAIKTQQLHIVLGVVNDKELNEILPLFPKNAKYYFCKANIPRGLDATELAEAAKSYKLYGEAFNSVQEAYKSALKNAAKEDTIFVGGSIFVLGEVI